MNENEANRDAFPEYEISGIENIARGICVVDGFVLLCRPKKGGYTYLPGGHIEFGETSREALVREMREETGLVATAGELLGVVESQFDQHGQRHCEISLVYRLTLGACPQPSGACPHQPGACPQPSGACPHQPEACPQPSGACPHADARGLSPRLPPVTAQEEWIEFVWWPVAELSNANLLPLEMKHLVSSMGSDPIEEKC